MLEDFKALPPIQKQISMATIQLLYENGFDESQVIRMLNKSHGIKLSQETVQHFFSQFARSDIQGSIKLALLIEFGAS